jgi:hypothetical protein
MPGWWCPFCDLLSRRKLCPDQLGQWALITLTRKVIAATAPSAVNPPAQLAHARLDALQPGLMGPSRRWRRSNHSRGVERG